MVNISLSLQSMINMLKQDTRKDGIEAGNTQRSHLHAFGEDVRSLGVLLICNVMNKLYFSFFFLSA
ncbi:hypothetical protein YC2023_017288 [Brassica napus]